MTFPAIVVIAYNRPHALTRILNSIVNADYKYSEINLIISIDGGGKHNQEVKSIAQSFVWEFGEKIIIEREVNLGLRNHVIACGDLTNKYESIILLEEDCFVSQKFYDFALNALSFYASDKNIAGISLYSYSYYESFGTVFMPLTDGFDTYFMQVPSSLGQIWTRLQWTGFKSYYATNPIISSTDKLPEKVKTWPESSWKKYFYQYMVQKTLYFVYPQTSFCTNFGDVGTHFKESTQVYQVKLESFTKNNSYKFSVFEESTNKYDAYFEPLPECLIERGAKIDSDTCIDITGSKPLILFENKYALSNKTCSHPIKSFDDSLIPSIQNILNNLTGTMIHYGLREKFGDIPRSKRMMQVANMQSVGFRAGQQDIISGKYYKIGAYLFNPHKILSYIKRRIK